MPAKSPDCTKASTNTLEVETTIVKQATPTNEADSPPAFQTAALEVVERTSPGDAIPTLPMNVQQNSSLLDLPTEIRIRIFDFLLKPELPVCLLISTNIYVWGQGLPKDIASCARVCRHINREVQDIM
jgi:hypothetical protein